MELPSGPPPTLIYDPPKRLSRRPAAVVVWFIAIIGSVCGTGAAIFENSMAMFNPLLWIFLAVAVAPAVEEICKPLAIVFLLDKRPHWFRSRKEIVILAALSALVFASLENLLYIFVNNPGGSANYVIYRLTVCTALHMTASTVFGFGLAKMWRHIQDKGGQFNIDVCFKYYAAAAIIHGLYNGSAMLMMWSGVLEF